MPHFPGEPGHRPGPLSEAALSIHSPDPLVQKPALGLVLIRIPALGLQDQEAFVITEKYP